MSGLGGAIELFDGAICDLPPLGMVGIGAGRAGAAPVGICCADLETLWERELEDAFNLLALGSAK